MKKELFHLDSLLKFPANYVLTFFDDDLKILWDYFEVD